MVRPQKSGKDKKYWKNKGNEHMSDKRKNLEQQALNQFEDIAKKHGYRIFKKQGLDNRIPVEGNTFFQFGDLRVETKTHYIVIEVESAGGITNLVKFWYCIKKRPNIVKKPIILMHIFYQGSSADYGSHLALWDFMWDQMKNAIGSSIKASRYTYCDLKELGPIAGEFERYLIGK